MLVYVYHCSLLIIYLPIKNKIKRKLIDFIELIDYLIYLYIYLCMQ